MNKTGGSRGQELCDRTRKFALEIIRLYQRINSTEVGLILGRQLLRSGTSIGANVEEAQAAQSPKDFVAKMSIALKEARETRYWLLLLHDAKITTPSNIAAAIDEVDQFIRIIYTIIQNTKKKQKS